ncbi:MAG: hypothetical protein ACRC33_25065 [Gemmataceae bacterium]
MIRHTLPLCLLFAASLPGCGDYEPIRTETVPKPAAEPFEPKVRLLAAVFEHAGDQWFFKLVGPTADVSAHTEPFAKFVQSVRFTGKADDPVKWDVPAGWEAGPKKDIRFATFFLGKDKVPELTVFKFDRVSPLLDNVTRWCKLDLGRPPLRERELKKVTQAVKAGDKDGTLIDLTGPGPKPADPHAGMPAGMPKKMPGPLPLEYVAPAGWQETGPRPGFVPVLTAFTLDDGPPRTEATVVVMRGMTGDLLENVNRWRGQVGAKPLPALGGEPPAVEVGGAKGLYFDLEGDRRMLMVMAKRGDETWYFKLMGKSDVVGKNKAAFDEFLKSVKFNGGGR